MGASACRVGFVARTPRRKRAAVAGAVEARGMTGESHRLRERGADEWGRIVRGGASAWAATAVGDRKSVV